MAFRRNTNMIDALMTETTEETKMKEVMATKRFLFKGSTHYVDNSLPQETNEYSLDYGHSDSQNENKCLTNRQKPIRDVSRKIHTYTKPQNEAGFYYSK